MPYTADINDCRFTGHLGGDPDCHEYTRPDKTVFLVANFSIAVSDLVRTAEGLKELTTWVRCVAYDDLAEEAQQLRKGDKVDVVTRYQARTVQDTDGTKRYFHDFRVKDLTVITRKEQTEAYAAA